MGFLQSLIDILLDRTTKGDESFIFPYSDDKLIKRQQVWSNLQRGIVFEDKGIFLPWDTPYACLDRYREKYRVDGDRMKWYFGKRTILDGYESHVEAMKWVWRWWSRPVGQVDEFLGMDEDGYEKFTYLRIKLIDLLGDPINEELENFNNVDIGHVIWQNAKAQVSLVGIEQFACKYWLTVGLADHKSV